MRGITIDLLQSDKIEYKPDFYYVAKVVIGM